MSVLHGDCREVMATLDAASVDAIVTDPPYGLSFMGKGWDKGVPGVEFWQAAYRVLKPGAYLLAFGGTRTFHRMAVAIEDAGFEIRDTLSWLYGSGFPKSHDVGKAIDKLAGATGTYGDPKTAAHAGWIERGRMRADDGHEGYQRPWMKDVDAVDRNAREYIPATDAAKQWDGWGTALKPAWEPVIVARKPLEGTVAQNVLTHGTGAINVDACRIGTDIVSTHSRGKNGAFPKRPGETTAEESGRKQDQRDGLDYTNRQGRWPANVVLDDEAAALLDQQSGERKSGKMMPTHTTAGVNGRNAYGNDARGGFTTMETYGDTGGASRFFYTAKASRAERNAGLEGMPEHNPFERGGPSHNFERMGSKSGPRTNGHPTVKPISLMRWLVRLVTPTGGTVLDPFAGSGTTGCAASLEGFNFIGIEQDAEYVTIAERRIAHWSRQPMLLGAD